MYYKNCKQCGEVFSSEDEDEKICLHCKRKNERAFYKVRVFVRENPKANLQQISEVCSVSLRLLKEWIKKGMLEFENIDDEAAPKCARCQKSIVTGRYCRDCKIKTLSEMNNVLSQDRNNQTKRGTGGFSKKRLT